MKTKLSILFLTLILTGCGQDQTTAIEEPTGTMYAVSDRNLDEVYANLVNSLEENPDISIMAEVDFESNAREVQTAAGAARIIFFGNPNVGTGLMQRNQLAALDLPLRVHFFEQEGEVYAMYNSMQYLESRYNLQGIPALEKMAGALSNMVNNATGSRILEVGEQEVASHEGIITTLSELDFEQTYRRLRESLIQNPNWKVIAEVDHSENAAGVGLELRPTRLFLISNPRMQTTMLKDNPTAGIEFPSKMLVWEDENGAVMISYNDPYYLQQRHQMTGSDIELAETSTALSYIAEYAASDLGQYSLPDEVAPEF